MKNTKPVIIEALFFFLIVFLIIGEIYQTAWLINNWIFLTPIAKIGEIFAMVIFPLGFIIAFCEIFIGFRRINKN